MENVISKEILNQESSVTTLSTETSNALLHEGVKVQENCIIGLTYKDGAGPAEIGSKSVIRAGSIFYGDVKSGDHLQTGHNVVVREKTAIGRYVVIGTGTTIDGNVSIGNFVKIETNCYIPTHVTIGNRVFIGPSVTLTNDNFPLKMRETYVPDGPNIEDGVTIGGGVTICPGVRIGKGSFIAAGALVTKDVPPYSLVMGAPGKIQPLPDRLKEDNIALNWQKLRNELPNI